MMPTGPSFQLRETPLSPVDGLGEFISPPQNNMFESLSKGTHEPLPSRISRLYYINGYGMEIHPAPNGDFLSNLATREILVYSCGSLWTSIIPCLALKGVAGGIAHSPSLRAKVLLCKPKYEKCQQHSCILGKSECRERSRDRWIQCGRLSAVSNTSKS